MTAQGAIIWIGNLPVPETVSSRADRAIVECHCTASAGAIVEAGDYPSYFVVLPQDLATRRAILDLHGRCRRIGAGFGVLPVSAPRDLSYFDGLDASMTAAGRSELHQLACFAADSAIDPRHVEHSLEQAAVVLAGHGDSSHIDLGQAVLCCGSHGGGAGRVSVGCIDTFCARAVSRDREHLPVAALAGSVVCVLTCGMLNIAGQREMVAGNLVSAFLAAGTRVLLASTGLIRVNSDVITDCAREISAGGFAHEICNRMNAFLEGEPHHDRLIVVGDPMWPVRLRQDAARIWASGLAAPAAPHNVQTDEYRNGIDLVRQATGKLANMDRQIRRLLHQFPDEPGMHPHIHALVRARSDFADWLTRSVDMLRAIDLRRSGSGWSQRLSIPFRAAMDMYGDAFVSTAEHGFFGPARNAALLHDFLMSEALFDGAQAAGRCRGCGEDLKLLCHHYPDDGPALNLLDCPVCGPRRIFRTPGVDLAVAGSGHVGPDRRLTIRLSVSTRNVDRIADVLGREDDGGEQDQFVLLSGIRNKADPGYTDRICRVVSANMGTVENFDLRAADRPGLQIVECVALYQTVLAFAAHDVFVE